MNGPVILDARGRVLRTVNAPDPIRRRIGFEHIETRRQEPRATIAREDPKEAVRA